MRASCECCGVAGRWSWTETEAVESLNTVMPDSELLSLLGRLSAVKANSNSDPDRMGDGLDEIGSIVSQALSRLARTPPAHLAKFFNNGADCCPACGCTVLFVNQLTEDEVINKEVEEEEFDPVMHVECSQCQSTWKAHMAVVAVSDLQIAKGL